MGIVRRNGQVILPDMFDKDRSQLLARLAACPALALEVSARLLFCDFRSAMPFVLPMLVHSLEPKRHPAAAGFEMRDFELGELLQHAVRAEVETSEHLFQWMASDMTAEFTVAIRA